MWRTDLVRRVLGTLSCLAFATAVGSTPAEAARPQTAQHTPAEHAYSEHTAAEQTSCPVVITGEVQADEAFHASINSSLQLLLDPVPHGWILRVLPAAGPKPAEDMAELATPPFRSINPLLLTTDFGLRAQDVVGWNSRSFHYLRSRVELAGAEQAFRAVTATAHPTPAVQAAVVRIASNAAEGRLEILDARLVPGLADQSPAAALVATHFLSTAHTILPPSTLGAQGLGQIGRVEWLRFRVTFEGNHPRRAGEHCH